MKKNKQFMENKDYKTIDGHCVNSQWFADFLAGDREVCQCNFKCKVKVQHKGTGHIYIINEEEFDQIFNIRGIL